MAKLALSKAFLNDFARLDVRIKNKVHEHVALFEQLDRDRLYKHKGLHLEPHTGSADPRARTIRIDLNHRGIIFADDAREVYVLTTVGTHDETDRWMANNTFKINVATGAMEVVDVVSLQEGAQAAVDAAPDKAEPIFAHRRDKDFEQLGIEADLVPTLRAFTDDAQLHGIIGLFPQGQAETLIDMLDVDTTVEEIYRKVVGRTEPVTVDTDDFAVAIEARATLGTFHLIDGQNELDAILQQPLSQWRVFIHPDQQELAYRDHYSGPARVTGGAGTGKTVVAMHRAKALAGRLDDRRGKPILFTTFTRNLAEDIEQNLRQLGGTELLDVVEVLNVDRVAFRLVQTAEGARPNIADNDRCRTIWRVVIDDLGLTYSPDFLMNEWEQVILAQNLKSRTEYFQASRTGRGVRLDRRPRAEVWKAYELFIQRMRSHGLRTYLQVADDAAEYARTRAERMYRHVVVDETQDLHEVQLRLLRELVDEAPDDLFLVGDAHQRIYDRKSSLAKAGIKVVGRSRRLRLNYRTTHQILAWSLMLLGEATFDDLDGGVDGHSLGEYFSCRSGPEPELSGHDAMKQQLDALVERVQTWTSGGIPPEEIGVAARTGRSLDGVKQALEAAGIQVCRLPKDDLPNELGVRIGTMHRMKGLEFPRMAIVDVDDDTLPLSIAMTNADEDLSQHAADLLRERCLLYVAATRARDGLWVGWRGRPSRFLEPALTPSQITQEDP